MHKYTRKRTQTKAFHSVPNKNTLIFDNNTYLFDPCPTLNYIIKEFA